MELALREARARLSEIIAAAENGEGVVITKQGEPAVEIVPLRRPGGIDFDKLSVACWRLGIEVSQEKWPADFDSLAFSRRVLGIE